MTPAQIETAARRKYNSTGSSFFAQSEIFDLIYQAELEIARETRAIEVLSTSTTTTAGTQSYSIPSTILELKRVEVNGIKLKRIDLRDDDNLTLLNSATTSRGTPLYYYVWNDVIYLRPIPDTSSQTIKMYGYGLPAAVTSTSQTLEVPAVHHMSIVDYVVAEMIMKDQQPNLAQVYFDKWYNKHMPAIIKWCRKRKVGDAFNIVHSEEETIGTYLGSF